MVLTRRRRAVLIAALSLALHAAVLGWLAWPQRADFFANGPDLSSMTVELARPSSPEHTSPARSSRRVAVVRATASTPVVAQSEASAEAAPPSSAPPSSVPAAAALPDQAQLRAALRAGAGCARSASRSREEREACEERLGSGRTDGPSYAAPMDPEKRAYYDELAAAGSSSRAYGDATPKGVSPGAVYFRVLNCSVKFGSGAKEKDRQGMVRLGKTPCYIPLQGSFFTPEAGVHKR